MTESLTMLGFKSLLKVSLILVLGVSIQLQAQEKTKPTGGFLPVLSPNPASSELEKQDDLWIMDVSFKPIRMMPLELTDAKTGQKKVQNVWYLVYKTRNKALERPGDAEDQTPINTEDAKRIGNVFSPEFELITHDNKDSLTYRDQILPEAVKLISKRERLKLKNVIEISGELESSAKPDYHYGVAVWTGIDPRTDFFTIYASGFSSAFKVNKDNDTILKRTIVLKYARPGDKYEEVEQEFRPLDDAAWIYRPASDSADSAGKTAAK